MRYQLTPDTPRLLSQCGSMVAPNNDVRWKGVPGRLEVINTLRRIELQRRQDERQRGVVR